MKSIFNFHFRIKWTIFMLFQLLFILASVHCIKDRNLNSFSEVLNSGLKNDTNPCNDFYHYACGKWIESHELHDTFEKWNVDIMAGLTTIKLIKEILEDPNIDENNEELSAERKFYNACINEDYSRDEGLKLFRNIVGTPQTSWQETVKYFTNLSFFDLFHIKLTENNYLQVERPQFSESNRRPFSETSPETTDRVKFIYKALDIDMRLRIQQVYESLDFIESVNEITLNGEEDIQEVSILQLQEMYDNHCPSKHAKIEWIKFFKSLAKGTRAVFKNDSQLIVDVQYLKDLCEQLSKTPEHAIGNYV